MNTPQANAVRVDGWTRAFNQDNALVTVMIAMKPSGEAAIMADTMMFSRPEQLADALEMLAKQLRDFRPGLIQRP